MRQADDSVTGIHFDASHHLRLLTAFSFTIDSHPTAEVRTLIKKMERPDFGRGDNPLL
jgi:hypothetical protein